MIVVDVENWIVLYIHSERPSIWMAVAITVPLRCAEAYPQHQLCSGDSLPIIVTVLSAD